MRTEKAEAVDEANKGWWRFPMMWLVVGGPSVVVVASMLTLTLALRHPDPVLDEHNETAATSSQKTQALLAPAMKARNHAATGGQ